MFNFRNFILNLFFYQRYRNATILVINNVFKIRAFINYVFYSMLFRFQLIFEPRIPKDTMIPLRPSIFAVKQLTNFIRTGEFVYTIL